MENENSNRLQSPSTLSNTYLGVSEYQNVDFISSLSPVGLMSTRELVFERIHPSAQLPQKQTLGSAGMDVHACVDTPVTITPGEWKLISTGLKTKFPADMELQVRSRSGLALKHGVCVLNAPGTIDSDYQGELGVILINLGKEDFVVSMGDRIAQLVPAKVEQIPVVEGSTDRSISSLRFGGFGSTGI